MRVTLVGGHGKVALLATPLLIEAGHRVRSWVRDPAHMDDVAALGATPVLAGLESASIEELTELLEGQDAVVWSAGAGGGSPDRTRAVDRDAAIRTIDAAGAAGARRFVMVSFSGAFPEHLVPEDDPFRVYQDAKIAADDHLRASDLDWTVLGPGTLTEDPGHAAVNPRATFRDGDRTSRALVAQVIDAILTDHRTYGRTLVLGDGDVPLPAWLGSP